jgi:thioredoxin reductase
VSPPVDAVVVGGGPAGLAAAAWLARYRRSVVVLDSDEYRSRWTDTSHGYLGRDRCPPETILDAGRADLDAYPTVTRRHARVEQVRREDDAFVVSAQDETHRGRRLVLATGVRDEFPDVTNFFTHYGASVFHCPSCDGYEARERRVVAFGWSADLAAFALGLLDWAARVTVVAPPALLAAQSVDRAHLEGLGVGVVEGLPAALDGERGDLRCVRLADGERLDCELAFFSIAHHPLTDLAQQLGCRVDDDGYVAVDEHQQTSVEGVYAAGDLTPGMQLIQVAAAEGATAGIAAALSLQGAPAAAGAPAPAPDVAAAVDES